METLRVGFTSRGNRHGTPGGDHIEGIVVSVREDERIWPGYNTRVVKVAGPRFSEQNPATAGEPTVMVSLVSQSKLDSVCSYSMLHTT